MTWILTHFERSLSPLLASACFFSAISQAAADTITQADADRIAQAIAAALQLEKFYTYPFDEYSDVSLSEFLATDPFDIDTSVANLVDDWGITINNYLTSDLLPMVSGIRDSVGTSQTDLASVRQLLSTVQGDVGDIRSKTYDLEGYLSSMLTEIHDWSTDLETQTQDGLAWRVHDSELLDAILDLRTQNDSNIYDVTSGIGQFQGDVSNALASLSFDISAVVDTLEDGGSLSGLGSGIDPSTDLGVPDTNTLSAPPVVGISTSNLQADLTTMNLTGGDSVITFWDETDLGGFTVPAASLDLASPRMSRAVSRMRDISVTLWWLAFFTAVYLLCRREITYYASLAHTEGN